MRYVIGFLLSLFAGFLGTYPKIANSLIALSEQLPLILGILLAAILFRLARGIPAIPYDRVAESRAKTATDAFRSLVKSYVYALAIFLFALAVSLIASSSQFTETVEMPVAAIGFLLGSAIVLCVVSIVFLASSDVKIALLQADLIDEVTGGKSTEAAKKSVNTVQDAFKKGKAAKPSVRSLD